MLMRGASQLSDVSRRGECKAGREARLRFEDAGKCYLLGRKDATISSVAPGYHRKSLCIVNREFTLNAKVHERT